jgi:hypothetical protein
MRIMLRRVLLLTFAVAAAGAALRSNQIGPAPGSGIPGAAQGAATGQNSLRGIVVNGATGEPVPRALVRLNMTAPKMALSGPDGRFQFDDLPAAGAIVYAQKPGFYTPQEMGLNTRPYSLIQIGKDAPDIKVNLYPCASITGRVMNGTGDPLHNVQVRAFYQRVVNGESRLEERGSAFTDDSGAYQISNLVPGKYYVATVSHSARILSPNVRPFNVNFDEVYPALYYPNSPDRSGASTVDALPGQQAEADFTEDIRRAYAVSGTIGGASTERMILTLLDRDGGRVTGRVERKNGTFRISGVVPGEYSVVAETIRGGNETLYGITPVTVGNTDVDGVSVELFPAATIQIQTEWDTAPSDNGQPVAATNAGVHLTPEIRRRGNDEYWSRPDNRDGQTAEVLQRVLPGSYRVTLRSNPRGYLASLRSGQTDLTQNRLVVTPGAAPAPIQVVFRGGAATLNGTIKGATGVSCWIVIAPDSDSPVEYNPISAAGRFTISGLAPGAYHIYALTSVDGLEYRNREVMRKFDNQATSVNLSENETKQIEVELIGGTGA